MNAARSAAIPMSVTDTAQAAALASLEREDELLERVAQIVSRRDALRAELIDQGWEVPVAQGNFLWLPTGDATAEATDAFFSAGLAVRAFAPEGIRISVGETESVESVIKITKELVGTLRKKPQTERLG